jgi:AraC-like DNA-binding protein
MPAPAPRRIPATSVSLVVAALEVRGWSSARLETTLGLDPGGLGADGTLPLASAGALLDLALHVLGPTGAADTPRRIPHGRLGLLEHLCVAAPTPRAALTDLARYFRLVAFGASIELSGDSLTFLPPPGMTPAHQQLLATLLFALLLDRLGQQAGVSARRAELPRGPTPGPWGAAIGGHSPPRLHFTPGCLDQPSGGDDPALRALLGRYAADSLPEPAAGGSTAARVREILLAAMPGPSPTAEQVARALGQSDRAMRRRLKAEGLRFSVVRDACLCGVAQEALRDPTRSVGEVAWLLGYAEPSAFHRAFRRWTGTTPARFRGGGRAGQ